MTAFSVDTDVRHAMLMLLGDPIPANCTGLSHRIRIAPDQAHLWHLREELMLVLALRRGEAWAASAVAEITAMFTPAAPRRPTTSSLSRVASWLSSRAIA